MGRSMTPAFALLKATSMTIVFASLKTRHPQINKIEGFHFQPVVIATFDYPERKEFLYLKPWLQRAKKKQRLKGTLKNDLQDVIKLELLFSTTSPVNVYTFPLIYLHTALLISELNSKRLIITAIYHLCQSHRTPYTLRFLILPTLCKHSTIFAHILKRGNWL